MTAIPFPVGKGESEVHQNNNNDERIPRGADRRSAWNDPRFFAPMLFTLLSTVVSITVIISSGRSEIANVREQISELRGQVAALQSLASTTTQQKTEIEEMKQEIAELKTQMTTQQQAYNFNFSTRLATVEAKCGIKGPTGEKGN